MGEFEGPFSGAAAVRAGRLTRHELTHFRRLHRDVYADAALPRTPVNRARAAVLWARGDGVLAGLSAAAMHGSRWVDDNHPATLIRGGTAKSVRGITVHTNRLWPDEITVLDGLAVTTVARTIFDLGRWLAEDEAIIAIDALCNATKTNPADAITLLDRHPGARGICRLRSALAQADSGSQSPQETRTRLLIVRDGLPVPGTQQVVADQHGRTVAESDLGWERWRVVVEYDGSHHWWLPKQRTRDINRYHLIEEAGWAVVRVDAGLLFQQPGEVLRRVRAKLAAAGADL